MNKGHQREKQNVVFIDKWSLFVGYFVLFYQIRIIEVWPLFTGWSFFGGGLSYRFGCIMLDTYSIEGWRKFKAVTKQ